MEVHSLRATARTQTKKGPARRLRGSGQLPGAIHAAGCPTQLIALNGEALAELRRGPHGWNQPVSIDVEGGTRVELAMLHEVQRHPVSGALLHADFVAIGADSLVEVDVPVITVGKAAGEEAGGRVAVPRRTIKLRCRIQAIPRNIEVNVTAMQIGDRVLASELSLPEGVELVDRSPSPVVTLSGKRGSEEKAAPAAAAPAAPAKKA